MREREKIAHLLRRTGFACSPEEYKSALRLGYQGTVRNILQRSTNYKLAEAPPATPVPPAVIPVTLFTFAQGVLWWMKTLSTTVSPLNERLTMFWHRHFATSGAKVFRPGWMFEQNQTFRNFGNGSFSDLLGKMVEDPALLLWLDAHNNPASNPNENLARELLELFTLGIGHYTEKDVKQLAKLTTGRRVVFGGRTPVHPKGEYDGPVMVLEKRGQLKLKQVAKELAFHPATAERMVEKLWEEFAACPLPEAEKKRLTRAWLSSRANVTVVLRAIFLSEHFFDAPEQRVSSPVEYWVACTRLLKSAEFKLDDTAFLQQAGEQLFFPPSVKGWDLGQAMIHPAALQTRMEIANRVVSRLPEDHFALRGLKTAADPARYLSHLTCGQLKASTLPSNLADFPPRQALLLALAGPDMWLS